jgi:2-polyprenyl-3-methyl-5-hydroxy-6-metoxy-1,4-benzoquinol methylase
VVENKNIEILEECPWCTSKNNDDWGGGKRGFHSVICRDCQLIYVKNRYNSTGLKNYYENYLSDKHQNNEQELADRSKMYQLESKYIEQYISSGKVLDVGCSAGYFLDCFNAKYFKCSGVEFGAEAARESSKKYKVYQGEFNAINIEERFDLIIFRGVIEHIPYPKTYLEKAISLLNKGGYIYITSTPDSNAFCCDLFKENWNQHEPEAHLMHFNTTHFKEFFNKKNMNYIDSKHFYRETPYCDFESDILKVAKAIKLKNKGEDIPFKSPAFYENMMSLIYRKNF